MRNNRFGCLTGTGILAALITCFVIVGAAFAGGNQVFTAGPLNNLVESGEKHGGVSTHAEINECGTCHVAPWGRMHMADQCLDCHVDIARQMLNVAGLHSAINRKDPDIACFDCHPEHRGATASLTEIGDYDFPHEALGFSLQGHRRKNNREAFICSDCHGQDATTFSSDSCQSCHSQMDIVFSQVHLLSFGSECLACHDGIDRYGDDFDHDSFSFPLSGGHREASCSSCHLDARTVMNLQSAPQDCPACHLKDDPHQGAYGKECGACHNPSGWKPANFDHNLSPFKLEGEHAQADCEDCHQNGFKGTSGECVSCHGNQDAHNGQYGRDCGSCHVPTEWENANFDHSQTRLPLAGGHANLACASCHQTGTFAGLSPDCAGCHADPGFHGGAFGLNCVSCHSTFAWTPAGYNLSHPMVADEGGRGINHGGATCRTCHPGSVYQSTCTACHRGNNFEDEGDDD